MTTKSREAECDCGATVAEEVVDHDSCAVLGLCESCIAWNLENGAQELGAIAGRRVFSFPE